MYSGSEPFGSCIYCEYIVFFLFLYCVLVNGILYFNVVEFLHPSFSWLVFFLCVLQHSFLPLPHILLCSSKSLQFHLLHLYLIYL